MVAFKHAMGKHAMGKLAMRLGTTLLVLFCMIQAAVAEPLRIVGFGDSLMVGYDLAPGQSFAERLQAALQAGGYDATVANAGVSGDTTSGGLARLDWSVPEGTDFVILELGANDMLRGIAPAEIEKNLDAMLARLDERGIGVLLAGMLAAPNLGPDYARAFDAIYPRLARKHAVTFYPFFLEGVATQSSLNLADGMHPNAEGIGRIVDTIMPTVTKMLDDHGHGT